MKNNINSTKNLLVTPKTVWLKAILCFSLLSQNAYTNLYGIPFDKPEFKEQATQYFQEKIKQIQRQTWCRGADTIILGVCFASASIALVIALVNEYFVSRNLKKYLEKEKLEKEKIEILKKALLKNVSSASNPIQSSGNITQAIVNLNNRIINLNKESSDVYLKEFADQITNECQEKIVINIESFSDYIKSLKETIEFCITNNTYDRSYQLSNDYELALALLERENLITQLEALSKQNKQQVEVKVEEKYIVN